MKNALFLCLLFFVFSCKPNSEYSEERLELLATNLDSLLVDLGKSGKLIDLQNVATMPASLDKIENLFYPANSYNSVSESNSKISAKSLIDTLKVNDTLHIYYKEYGCFHSFENICVIVKNKNDYTVLQQNFDNYPDIYYLRGDSVLISFYNSTNKKLSNNILSTKDTNNLNKLSRKYLKQTFKNYKSGNTDIYCKVKELQECTATSRNNTVMSTTRCSIIFLWKNIRQERYYKDGNCRAIF